MDTEPKRFRELETAIDAVFESYTGKLEIDNLESAALPNKRAVTDAVESLKHVIFMGFYGTRDLAPGNLLSKPRLVHIGSGNSPIAISLDGVIPPIEPAPDTKYIRHIRIQSALLTKFWGRPMYLSAIVLVPEGFDSHPEAHFPLIVAHDHFVGDLDDDDTLPSRRPRNATYRFSSVSCEDFVRLLAVRAH